MKDYICVPFFTCVTENDDLLVGYDSFKSDVLTFSIDGIYLSINFFQKSAKLVSKNQSMNHSINN